MFEIDRRFLFFAGAAACAFPLSAMANDAAGRKINIAGRQRMLSQRMAMAAFTARAEVAPDDHLDILTAAYSAFDAAQRGLREGSSDLGLPRESDPETLAALDAVDALWARYGAAIGQIAAAGGVEKQEMGTLAALNLEVLARADDVVKTLVRIYGGGGADRATANAIDMAGRQRMLSQKMVKEVALIALKYQRAENRSALGETVALFDTSLYALLNGDPIRGVPAPPPDVAGKFRDVEAIWSDTKPIFDDIVTEGAADIYDLQAIAENRDPLLDTSNDAVFLYEKA